MMTVNVGGYSSVYRANVTGTGISDLIVTGSASAEPGKDLLPAPGSVYEYTDLLPARYASIQEAQIFVSVPQLWFNGNGLTPQDIVIYHLSDSAWTVVPSTLVKSESGRSYYTALSPGLGRFAITGDNRRSAVPLVIGKETPQGTFNDMVKATVTQVVPTLSRTPVALQTTEVPAPPATQPSAGFSSLTIVAGIFGILILIGLALVVRKRKSDL
jgi:LPXTG-motif cell wall-anchored protein